MANLQLWKMKAKALAKQQGHSLGTYINWPPSHRGQKVDPETRALGVCRQCEATVMVGPDIEGRFRGTAIERRCPYVYSPRELSEIHRANPVR
jgi:hypothetical protein